jgi:hypothetical protein
MGGAARDLARSTARLSWALSLFGLQQMADLASGSRDPERGAARCDAVRYAAEGQMNATFRGLLHAGDNLQRGVVDLLAGVGSRTESAVVQAAGQLLTPDLLDPRTWATMGVDMVQRSAEGLRLLLSGTGAVAALREVQNKAEVYVLVRQVARLLGIPEGEFPLPLFALLARAYALGPFPALWAIEGLGHDYARSYQEAGIVPRDLLTAGRNEELPSASLLMLNAGIGLAFAEWELKGVNACTPYPEVRRTVAGIVALCRANARPGYLGAAYESLGLVTRLFHGASLPPLVDRALREVAPEVVGFFWHGVGRAIYFAPANFLPGSTWQVFEMARREAPDESARLNAVAGAAWAVTLVNQRQPEIVAELLIRPHGEELRRDGAFSNGLTSGTIMRTDTTPEAGFVESFLAYRPTDPQVVRLWDELVRIPGEEGLRIYYPILQAENRLGDLFHYGDLARLAAELSADRAREPLGRPPEEVGEAAGAP